MARREDLNALEDPAGIDTQQYSVLSRVLSEAQHDCQSVVTGLASWSVGDLGGLKTDLQAVSGKLAADSETLKENLKKLGLSMDSDSVVGGAEPRSGPAKHRRVDCGQEGHVYGTRCQSQQVPSEASAGEGEQPGVVLIRHSSSRTSALDAGASTGVGPGQQEEKISLRLTRDVSSGNLTVRASVPSSPGRPVRAAALARSTSMTSISSRGKAVAGRGRGTDKGKSYSKGKGKAAKAVGRRKVHRRHGKLGRQTRRLPGYGGDSDASDGSEAPVERKAHRRTSTKEIEKVEPHYKFWADLDGYFQPISDEHLKLLQPVEDDANDPAYQVPPIAHHYADDWHDQELMESPRRGHKKRGRKRGSGSVRAKVEKRHLGGTDDEDAVFGQHSLAQRILSALVEEKLTTPRVASSDEGDSGEDSSKLSNLAPRKRAAKGLTGSVGLEDRILMELKSVGIFESDEQTDLEIREDDEVCARLRLLQSQLHDVRKQNNVNRRRLYSLVVPTLQLQERQYKFTAADKAIVDVYRKRKSVLKGVVKHKKNTEKYLSEARTALDRYAELQRSYAGTAAGRGLPGLQPQHYTTYLASGIRSTIALPQRVLPAHGSVGGGGGESRSAAGGKDNGARAGGGVRVVMGGKGYPVVGTTPAVRLPVNAVPGNRRPAPVPSVAARPAKISKIEVGQPVPVTGQGLGVLKVLTPSSSAPPALVTSTGRDKSVSHSGLVGTGVRPAVTSVAVGRGAVVNETKKVASTPPGRPSSGGPVSVALNMASSGAVGKGGVQLTRPMVVGAAAPVTSAALMSAGNVGAGGATSASVLLQPSLAPTSALGSTGTSSAVSGLVTNSTVPKTPVLPGPAGS